MACESGQATDSRENGKWGQALGHQRASWRFLFFQCSTFQRFHNLSNGAITWAPSIETQESAGDTASCFYHRMQMVTVVRCSSQHLKSCIHFWLRLEASISVLDHQSAFLLCGMKHVENFFPYPWWKKTYWVIFLSKDWKIFLKSMREWGSHIQIILMTLGYL